MSKALSRLAVYVSGDDDDLTMEALLATIASRLADDRMAGCPDCQGKLLEGATDEGPYHYCVDCHWQGHLPQGGPS